MDARKLCTCRDTACPCHPVNHDQGCTLCIAKNRKQGEIPACFFNEVGRPEGMKDYFYHDFAECVMRKEQRDSAQNTNTGGVHNEQEIL